MTQAAQCPRHPIEPSQIWGGHQATEMLATLRLPRGRPLILLNGSTNAALTQLYEQAMPILKDGLARWLVTREAVAITGGTNAGIFALLGQGFGAYGRPAACVGVTVAGLVQHREDDPGGVALEPHHTHAVLVPGKRWGDETAAMYALAAAYGSVERSLTVLVGGGPTTLKEIEACVAQGRRVLAVEGSGGVADDLLAVVSGSRVGNEQLQRIARLADLYRMTLHTDPDTLGALLDHLLP